jgi:hypothetical protein
VEKEEAKSKKTSSIRVSKQEKQDTIHPLATKKTHCAKKISAPAATDCSSTVCLTLYGCINGFNMLFV